MRNHPRIHRPARLTRTARVLAAVPLVSAAALAVATVGAAATSSVEPLDQAHAHNDYEHERPLLDALDHGFTSVEADVWLVDGELLVAHDAWEVDPDRTLESLYLDPLRDIVHDNGGSVYPGWDGSLQLLIDIKNTGEATYAEIDRTLRRYQDMMTRYVGGRVQEKAVTAVISGDRPRATMREQRLRFAGYDGRLADLGSGLPAGFMPLVSDNWNNHFTWQGVGPMPAAEREKLRRIVSRAHDAGYRVRFWATPDRPTPAREALWSELVAAGVDHLNTDDLAGLAEFLGARVAGSATAS
ncbi:glycerophosphoryl diester phosphodiesterase [Haloactinopolyspora alba]|uniref:Altered inheritance of mitochondria protein 6 n=1 Tax=Haloactinopolyspora alba TaxID=648780 RepID=A0A2P8DHH5_9ACTN|nr:phosphatidylinositol-specific phospholipase C/glycerophosphodiester phosphodiesterase family protein [Haloactinopolyspora alba]PSK96661.1 glycerophosphoryl diester phosphodiesterase [Haloactinopolyspora alba]